MTTTSQRVTAWTPQEGISSAVELFTRTFGTDPAGVWASPGRVNLIGDHVDYNGGLCLPIALPHQTYVALSPAEDGRVRIVSDFEGVEVWEGRIEDIAPGGVEGWVAYAAGPAWVLREDGLDVGGFDAAITSCVPVGAGLSSSAAVECSMALALAELAGRPFSGDDADRARLAALCTRAENLVAGAPTGGLDQAASLRAGDAHALLLDCADGAAHQVKLPFDEQGHAILAIDTHASHQLGDGQYADRRASCEEAASLLGVGSLREVADTTSVVDLDAVLDDLPEGTLRSRTRHVLTEIWRVQEFVTALEAEDIATAGRLMVESHASLRDDFEVSVAELDTVVEAAMAAGASGARMTGGGFGGSVVVVAPERQVAAIAEGVRELARRRGLPEPQVHQVRASAAGGRLR